MSTPSKLLVWMACLPLLFALTFCNAQTKISDEWLILGPFSVAENEESPSEEVQKKAFDADHLEVNSLTKVKAGNTIAYQGKQLSWKSAKEENHIVNLDEIYDTIDYAAAYAWTEIKSSEDKKVLLGVGSDDGVKVWLNGELVHDNWIPRGVVLDDDLVPVTLKKGKNQLVIKVQDLQGGWGFSCRILPPEVYTEKLTEAAEGGRLEEIELLLDNGADINAKNALGLTALHSAKIQGREDVVETLVKKGADANIPMPAREKLADAMFEKLIGDHEPGATVLIARDGKILYKNGFGYADLEKDILITPETEFRIGSITKQFTAAAILKLYEEGKIVLDDKLSRFVPDFPRGDEVTIHHLLTHTSGIKSYTDKINFESEEVKRPIESLEAHIESFKHDPYNFDPGTAWSYNNSGYFLLGFLIEKVSGKPYGEYLKEEFFEPLGMDHTGLHYKGVKLDHEAMGYSFQNGKPNRAPDWEMTWAGGAGAMYSTVDDLYKWNEAVFNGKVLKKETLEQAFTPVTLSNGKESSPKYGYGWMIGELRGWKDISHGGGLPGFITFLTRFPEKNVTITVLTNAAPSKQLDPQRAAYDLAELFFWEEMAAKPTFAINENVDTKSYADYVGRYDYRGGAVLTVTVENDKLFAQLSGQPKFEIFPHGGDKFFWKVVDAQVAFVRDEDGKIEHAVHTQNGQTFEAPRLKEEKVVAVDPSVLDMYVGHYDMNGADVTVTRQDAQMFVQVTGQPQFEIFAKSQNEFFLKAVNAALTFVSNGDGQVEKIVLDQGGAKFDLPRKK